MDELLEALGLKLEFNDLYIRLIRPLVYIETGQTSLYNGLPGQILTYQGGGMRWQPAHDIIWSYKTEFAEQLERYNAKQYQPYTMQYPQLQQQSIGSPWGQALGIPQGITSPGTSGLYIQGSPQYQGLQQSQLGQSQQLQRAALQQNVYHPYGVYQSTSEPEEPKKFTLWDKIKKLFK
jgi:hypothetical protein